MVALGHEKMLINEATTVFIVKLHVFHLFHINMLLSVQSTSPNLLIMQRKVLIKHRKYIINFSIIDK